MEIRDLEYFAVVARHGNVRKASEELGLSPPALSKSLRRLEEAMGARLVERSSKGVRLTAVGAALAEQAQRVQLTLRDVARKASDLGGGRIGHLRIGTGAARGEDMAPAFLQLLRESPGLSLEIQVTDNDVMVPQLCQGNLDIIFNPIPVTPYQGTVQERLFDEEWIACASAAHPLAKRRQLTLKDLVPERWALSGGSMLYVEWLNHAFQSAGLPAPQAAVTTRSHHLRLHTIAHSPLIGFMSRQALDQVGARLKIRPLQVKGLTLRRPIGIIYRNEAYLSPPARRLVDLLRGIASKLDA